MRIAHGYGSEFELSSIRFNRLVQYRLGINGYRNLRPRQYRLAHIDRNRLNHSILHLKVYLLFTRTNRFDHNLL
ncbi:hypothetical protein D3C81_2046210 [compost metagenome]